MSLKKTNGVGLKKEENITQARLSNLGYPSGITPGYPRL